MKRKNHRKNTGSARSMAVFAASAILGLAASANAAIINVPADQPTIQAAITASVNGDEVVVAPDTYNETINLGGKAITLRSTDPNDPAVVASTIIDAQGAGTVISCNSGETASTVVSGFTIIGGSAGSGGGMRNTNSSPTVTDCIFMANSATFGGGIENNNSSPTVTDCIFTGNTASNSGGGMNNFNDSSPSVTNCTFTSNSAGFLGGGMYNFGSSPTVTGCTFTENLSNNDNGGGMYNSGGNPTVISCAFTGNSAVNRGGGMSNFNTSPTVTNCTFTDNTATSGGGMGNRTSSPVVSFCTFTGNIASDTGGGMYNNLNSFSIVTNSIFTGNSASFLGGGMYNLNSSPVVAGCTFTANFTINFNSGGGGMLNESSNSIVTNCIFTGNTATIAGGGMSNSSSTPIVTNCTFIGNTVIGNGASDVGGGGLFNTSSPSIVTNCTFTGNTADFGGGIFNTLSSPTVTNCILWGDTPSEINNVSGSAPFVTHSNIQGGFTGTGNVNSNPFFIDADGADNIIGTIDDNVRLAVGSPCIDAGNNAAVPVGVLTDLDGFNRFLDDPATIDTGAGVAPIVDMGAFEATFGLPPCPADINGDGVVDVADLAVFIALNGFDLDGSGAIDTSDTAFILGAQGSAGPCSIETPGLGVTHSIIENVISNDAVLNEPLLSDARSFDLLANITNDDWLVSQVDIQVVHPDFILYHQPTRGRIDPPNPSFYVIDPPLPQLQFDSFLSIPTFDDSTQVFAQTGVTDFLSEDSTTRLRGDIFKSIPGFREGTDSGPIARFTFVGSNVANISIKPAPLPGDLVVATIEGHSHVESSRVTKVPFSFVAVVPCNDIINVPSVEAATIQTAIDAVCDGGTVMIAPGTGPYPEDINFNGKAVALDLPAGASIVSTTAFNISAGSVITGAGTITAPTVASAGTIAPDPGETITIVGNYIQQFNGVDGDLVIDLADGLTPTMLNVTGTATLHGRLRVMADPGVDPDIGFPIDGPPFTVLSAISIPIGDQFDFPVVPYLGTDRLFTITTDPSSVALSVVSLSRDVVIDGQPGAGFGNPADPKVPPPPIGIPRAATLADIDGDNDLDLLIALPDPVNPLTANGVVVILYNKNDGNPDNGWEGFDVNTQIVNVGIGANPSGIAVDLIDDDTQPDIVVSNQADNTVSVLFVTDGNLGIFAATPFTTIPFTTTPLSVGIGPADVTIADLDRDGFNDIATPNTGSGSVSIFWGGAGTGNAWAVEEIPDLESPECASSIEPGDFDAGIFVVDIRSFLATTHPATNSVGLIVVNGDRTFDLLPSLAVDAGPFDLVVVDLNLDGNDDIATVNSTGSSVNVLINSINGGSGLTFGNPSSLPLSATPLSIAAGNLDADADADIDLAVIVGGVVQILRNELDLVLDPTNLHFTAFPDQTAGVNPLIIRSGDVNNDRGDDLITISEATAARLVSDPVNILVTAPACDGDFNFDLKVGLADLQLLLFNFGQVSLVGDMNDDNIVNLDDLQILLFNFGNACP